MVALPCRATISEDLFLPITSATLSRDFTHNLKTKSRERMNMNSNLHRLVYCSRNLIQGNSLEVAAELKQILAVSRVNNTRDPRHSEVTVIECGPATARDFPGMVYGFHRKSGS